MGERLEPGLSDDYLNELKVGRGRVIIAAALSTGPACDQPGVKHGVFTKHLIHGLCRGARSDGGVIRIIDLYAYVRNKVIAEQPNQHPVLKVELEDNYPIAHQPHDHTPPIVLDQRASDNFKFDVFISYRRAEPDVTWVRKTLVPRLEAAGFSVLIDYREFRPGAMIVKEMERAVVQSRYTVGVLSPNYLTSSFVELERILAEQIGLEQSQQRFLGLMLANCVPPLSVRAALLPRHDRA